MVSNDITIIAKRIVKQMHALAKNQIDMNMFMGLGMALATIYEVATGRSVAQSQMKGYDTIRWALDLPQVPGHEIIVEWDIPRGMPGKNLVEL